MPDKFTVDEYNKMALNMLPRIERWGFRIQKWMLHHLGFLSKGMRVGLKYGLIRVCLWIMFIATKHRDADQLDDG